MPFPTKEQVDALRQTWTDCRVRVKPGSKAELTRFEGRVGRVVTVNYSGRAILDFADGAWYDLEQFEKYLEPIDPTDTDSLAKYDASVNSAQPFPPRMS